MNTPTIRGFLPPNDPRLSKAAAPVADNEFGGTELNDLIAELLAVASGQQGGSGRRLVGLAAPQIGIEKRIIVVDTMADGHGTTGRLEVFINPEVIYSSAEVTDWYEGCFSTGCVCGIVSRAIWAEIKFFTKTGEELTREFNGYKARIVLHEIDHLNGKTFPSQITDPRKLHLVTPEQFGDYRDLQQWKDWPHRCTSAQLKKLQETGSI